jgi:pimeloyl-ACP methyl ester carboxylesterase
MANTSYPAPSTGSIRCLSPAGFHTMRYRAFGDASNPRVAVCVHGLTRNAVDFDVVATELSKTHYVVCPDVVGRGESDWLADWHHYAYPQYLADMAALLAHLRVEQVDWVGTSMGGLIGMLIAAQPVKSGVNPIRKLVLNDVGPFIPKEALERLNQYVGRDPVFKSMDHYVAFVREISPFGELSDAQWYKLAASGAKQLSNGTAQSKYDPGIGEAFRFAAQGKPLIDIDLFGYWSLITVPVLSIRGAQSDLFFAETQKRMALRPGTSVVEFANCGHAPALLSKDQVDCITSYLNQ